MPREIKPLTGYVEDMRRRMEAYKNGERTLPTIAKPEDTLTYRVCKPDCMCNGSGFFTYDVPVGHPSFGKVYPCPNAPVSKKNAGLSRDEIENISWSDLIKEGNVQDGIDAIQNTLARGHGWVYLYGKPGRAKTLMLKRAVKDALGQQRRAMYVQTTDILGDLRSAFDAERKQFTLDSKISKYRDMTVLCIDEFDRFNKTGWADEQIQIIMNQRHESGLVNTITIMASNQSPSIYEAYLKDRIYDGRHSVIHLTGESLRPAGDQLGV